MFSCWPVVVYVLPLLLPGLLGTTSAALDSRVLGGINSAASPLYTFSRSNIFMIHLLGSYNLCPLRTDGDYLHRGLLEGLRAIGTGHGTTPSL